MTDIFDIPKPDYESPHEHSKYSPSGTKRWVSCPASIQMVNKAPEETGSNFYANEGTAAHELAAYCLDEQVTAASQIGKVFNKFTVDKEMARQTQKYVDYVLDHVPLGGRLWVENRVSMEHLIHEMFGTADAIIVSNNLIHVADLKFGRGVVVEATDNYQLQTYAIGVLAHLAKHGMRFKPDHEVKLTICQPRAPHPEGPNRSWMTTVGSLREFQEKLKIAIKESKSDNPSFGPTEDGCRWCPASPFCKAHARHNLELAKLEFKEFEKAPREFEETLCGTDTLTLDEMINIYRHQKAVTTWLNSIGEFLVRRLKSDKDVPHFKLVYGRSIRSWSDADKVHNLLTQVGIESDRLYNSKLRSPAQMEKELTSEEFITVEEFVFKPKGKIVMAAESDARKAINVNAQAADDWAEEKI